MDYSIGNEEFEWSRSPNILGIKGLSVNFFKSLTENATVEVTENVILTWEIIL